MMRYTFIMYYFVTNILNVDWFLLSKLFLKRIVSSLLLLREHDISQHFGDRSIRSQKSVT